MPRKPAAKPKPWTPPAGLKIEVGCFRGDVSLKAEAAVSDAVPVAMLLVAMMRKIGETAPDTLPYADSVPGMVLPYSDDEMSYDRDQRPVVGFRTLRPMK